VGCGRIAKRHADLLGGRQIPGAELAALCDVKPERANALAAPYGAPVYSDMHEMARKEQINAVSEASKGVNINNLKRDVGIHPER